MKTEKKSKEQEALDQLISVPVVSAAGNSDRGSRGFDASKPVAENSKETYKRAVSLLRIFADGFPPCN